MRVDEDDLDFDPDDYIVLYDGEPFTGEGVETDVDGNTLTLSTYVNGREHGPQYEWYSDGTPRAQGQVDGLAVGTWKHWHPNGGPSEEKVFSDTGDLLSHKTWDENGTPIKDRTYPARDTTS